MEGSGWGRWGATTEEMAHQQSRECTGVEMLGEGGTAVMAREEGVQGQVGASLLDQSFQMYYLRYFLLITG
jgi:hypothetical protein